MQTNKIVQFHKSVLETMHSVIFVNQFNVSHIASQRNVIPVIIALRNCLSFSAIINMAQIGTNAPEVVLKSVFSKYDKVDPYIVAMPFKINNMHSGQQWLHQCT